MKKRNILLLLSTLLATISLAACSSSMNTKGKGIAQLMNDNQERVFYSTNASSIDDPSPAKNGAILRIYITKGGKLKAYTTSSSNLKMDDVIGKNIDEVKKLAEENSNETYEIDKVAAKVTTDSSGNNTKGEDITLYIFDNKPTYTFFDSLTSGQIRDKYYAGYVEVHRGGVNAPGILITEVSKGDVINFDKADGKIVKEGK